MKTKLNRTQILSTPKSPDIGWMQLSLILLGMLFSGISTIKAQTPDNIFDNADCYILPPGTEWKMKELEITPFNNSTDRVHDHTEVLVGDLNDDGIPELIANGTSLNSVNIYDNKGVFIKRINTAPASSYSGKLGMAKVKTSASTYQTIIVVAAYDDYLYAYDYSGTQVWKSDSPYNRSGGCAAGVGFADFNNDGYAEVYANNAIFDAATGVLLCRGTSNNGVGRAFQDNYGNITIAADIRGDEKLELLAGNQVYEVNITNRTGIVGNSISVVQTLPLFKMEDGVTDAPADGFTTMADMDLDGFPDLVVQTYDHASSTAWIYIWSPHKNQMLARKTIETPVRAMGMPLIGDIDGDGRPEIVFMTVDYPDSSSANPKLWAYKYDGTDLLNQFWVLDHNDRSGFTGITLFDFNQDGISEIVFRDNEYMRIVNASGKSHFTGNDTISGGNPVVYDLIKLECTSSTAGEYPVVADLGEGTRIITTVRVTGGGHRLRIFGQDEFPWAPARKVWNQYAYFATNVNEDLTIPQYQFNPATRFPGLDGILGNADDVRPYNALMQQQTTLSIGGTPLWLAPSADITGTSEFNYDAATDSMHITIHVYNRGDVPLQAPFFITAYHNGVGSSLKYTYTYPNGVLPKETKEITFGIPNFKASSWTPYSNITINLNDNGNGANQQIVCAYSEREASSTQLILATADNAKTVNNLPVTIPVITNDALIATCHTPVITTAPQHGNATVVNDEIVYTPSPTYIGNDVLVYTVSCTSTEGNIIKTSAPVNITVYDAVKPGSIGTTKEICYNTNPEITSEAPASGGDGGGTAYQWQKSTNGTDWSNIDGATSATYNPGDLTTTIWYRRQATVHEISSNKTVYSNEIKITVHPKIVASFTAVPNYATFKIEIVNTSQLNDVATNSSTTGVVWQWKDEDDGTILATGFQPEITIPVKSTGKLRLVLVASVSDNCFSTHTEEMQVLTNVDLTVFLHGPIQTGGTMTNYIQEPNSSLAAFTQPRLPINNPYGIKDESEAIVSYQHINDINGPAGKVVDWVMVEILEEGNPANILETKALLLKPDGKIVDVDGNIPGFIPRTVPVFLAISHRNHVSIMSNKIGTFTGNIPYDFSTALSKAYNHDNSIPNPMILSNGKYCMQIGDLRKDYIVNILDTRQASISFNQIDNDGYFDGDVNMDGIVNMLDTSGVLNSANKIITSPLIYWRY